MNRDALLDDPQIQPFLPLLWVLWADGDIDDGERSVLTTKLSAAPWLRPAARHAIDAWLDPAQPPSATELSALRTAIERAAGTLEPEARRSLVALGASMAGANGTEESASAAREIASLLALDAVEVSSSRPVKSMDAAAIDVTAMQRVLDGDLHAVRDKVREFLSDPSRRAYGLPKDEQRAMVRQWMAELQPTGLLDLAFPGVTSETPDLRSFMTLFESLAVGDLSLVVKLGVQLGLFGGSLYFLGTERHRALLKDVASLKTLGCFAMSEVGHGSNVAELETVARYEHETKTLVIHTPRESARKEWIGGAARDARMATVFAQLEVGGQRHGVHAVLVRIRSDDGEEMPGVRIGDSGLKMGLNGVDNGRLWFDQVRVPVENLLDRFASITADGAYESAIASPSRRFFTMLGTLVGGRVCVGSAGVSVSKAALAIGVRYALARRQFGPEDGAEIPLLAYPTHQRRLLVPLATTYVLHFAFDRLREHFTEVHASESPDTRALEAEAAGLKAVATWHAIETAQQCREACGGQGYLAVNRLPDLKADSDVFATFEGDNTVLLQLVGKSLLTSFQKQLSGGAVAFIRMIAKIAAESVVDKNPIDTRRTDPQHLRDRDYHLETLRYREETLVRTVALRMQKRLRAKMSPHAALLEVQEHLLAASRAWVDRLALQWFAERVASVNDEGTKKWLALLGDLHALASIEKNAGWYLEAGWIAPEKARAIRKQVELAMGEVAPAAKGLVDAFAIPDACLAAPIAFFDPAHPP